MDIRSTCSGSMIEFEVSEFEFRPTNPGNAEEFSQPMKIVRTQPVFPEVVKLEPPELITVDNPSEIAGAGHSGKPKVPPAPRIGRIKMNHKRRNSPYGIDPRFMWSRDALPFISKPDERRTYTPRPNPSVNRTSAAASAGSSASASTGQEDGGSGDVDLSEFEKFLGKSLFPVKMPRVRVETSVNLNRNPNLLFNPVALGNSTEERTSRIIKTDSPISEETRQPRRAKSPSLLA